FGEFRERQERHYPGTSLVVDDHLFGVAKHLLHGLDEDALGGGGGRLLVLIVNADEAVGLTLGQRDHLIAIALRRLQDALRLAARLGDDAVGIGLRLVLKALLVGAGRLHVAEGVNDLRGRIDFLQLHLRDQDARTVAVEGLLHQGLGVSLGLGTRPGEDRLDIAFADDLAHGAFSHALHRAFGVLDVEQEIGGALDLPEHDEINIDDILIAGDHQALFGHVADRARGVADVGRAAHTDLNAIDARHLGQLDLLDRIGPAEVQTGRKLADILAKSKHDAELVGIDANGEAEKADRRDQHRADQQREWAAHAAARHGLTQPVLAAAQDLFEVGLLAGAWPG